MPSNKEMLQKKLKKWGASDPRFIDEHGGPSTIAFTRKFQTYSFSYTRKTGDDSPSMSILAWSLCRLIDLDIRGIFPFDRVAKDYIRIEAPGGRSYDGKPVEGLEHYRVLEVDPRASDDDVRKKYLALVGVYHPDRALNPESRKIHESKMAELSGAYSAVRKLRGF